jgi:hypothetical protein
VLLRKALLRYDAATTDKEREESLAEIKTHLYWNHDHTRPTNLKKITKKEDAKGGEDTSEEEDEELRRY